MNPAIFAAILTILREDATLTELLGGDFVYRAKGVDPAHIPSVTLLENNENSTLRTGYNTWKTRDQNPTLQVDIWVSTNQEFPPCTGEDADLIADRIDVILFAPDAIAGTRGWSRTSSSTQHDEDIGGVHIARRYSFKYKTTD